MNKLRVLHILNTGSYSGAENVAITIIKSMRESVDGIYLSKKGSIRKVLEQNNIEFYPVEKLGRAELKKAICDIKPDIIHAHDFTAGVIATSVNRKIPIINHLHNNSPWIRKCSLKSIIYALSGIRYDRIITVSESVMKEYIFGKYFMPKTTIVGNPYNVREVRGKAQIAEMKIPSDIIFLGRLSVEKNPFLFLDIIKSLSEKLPKVRAIMVGDGELRQQIDEKIKKMNLGNNITMYGFQENPYGLLNATKVLCMPSNYEGFGLAAVEALSFGKPVVASPVGGLVDIINSDCGKLCDTEGEFIKEIYLLLTEEKIYQSKSRRALARAKEYDNLSDYVEILDNIYYSIARKREV